jgi:hypothetical protein
VKRYLYYCGECKIRYQGQNFGYGYPRLSADGLALCPYCEVPMAEKLSENFPAEWVEEQPKIPADDSAPA